jgi:hypothetical protein
MKRVFSGFLLLGLVFGGYQSANVNGSQRSRSAVANGFSYPESRSTTIKHKKRKRTREHSCPCGIAVENRRGATMTLRW